MSQPILLLIAVLGIIISTARWKVHPLIALLIAAIGYGFAAGFSPDMIINSIRDGFGGTIGAIGIVILAGTIIGTYLEKSGGAQALAQAILQRTGEKRLPAAMSLAGYFLSIPVFCDSGFVILAPLNKALSREAGISLGVTAIALSLGLYASHTMVPPTPGPVAAAGILGADIGLVILWGIAISLPSLFIARLIMQRVAANLMFDPPAAADVTKADAVPASLPAAQVAIVPILVPILLIVLKSVAELPAQPLGDGPMLQLVQFAGNPMIALLLGVLLAFVLLAAKRSGGTAHAWVGEALKNSGSIILITGAGGAFGKVLQNSGIGNYIADELAIAGLGIWLPFLIAAALKTAQGSSTVAIITTATIISSMVPALGLTGSHSLALTVVAIGAGSMVVSHANDSYFWVVTQLSGMDVSSGYRLQSVGTLVQGLCAACLVWAASLLT